MKKPAWNSILKKKTKIMASGAIVLKVLVTHLCSTLHDLMDYGPPGSSIHGILQSRILEWVAIFFSRGIFPTEGSNPGLLRYQQILYCLSHQGSPNFMADRRGKGGKQWFPWAPKITVDGKCNHEIKRNLLLGRKATTNLDSVLKAETSLCQQRFI